MAVPPKLLQLEQFTAGARELITRAQSLADERQHVWITPFHVLACTLQVPVIVEMMRVAGADPAAARAATLAELAGLPSAKPTELSGMDKAAVDMLERAERRAVGEKVALADVVIALLESAPLTKVIGVGNLARAIRAFEHVDPAA